MGKGVVVESYDAAGTDDPERFEGLGLEEAWEGREGYLATLGEWSKRRVGRRSHSGCTNRSRGR